MSFSDEDLKQLKEQYELDKEFHENCMWIDRSVIKALLARLEAAEHLALFAIDSFCKYCGDNIILSHKNGCPKLKSEEAWRKAAGK